MTKYHWVQLFFLCLGLSSLLAASWLWSTIAGLIVLGFITLFLAYVVRQVQLDNERDAKWSKRKQEL